jgi:hypothetical protein
MTSTIEVSVGPPTGLPRDAPHTAQPGAAQALTERDDLCEPTIRLPILVPQIFDRESVLKGSGHHCDVHLA